MTTKSGPRLLFDFETNGLMPEVSKIHCIVAKDVDTLEVHIFRPDEIEEGLEFLLSASYLTGHNIIGYDLPVATHIYPDFPDLAAPLYGGIEIVDTLVMSKLVYSNIKIIDAMRVKKGQAASGFFAPHGLDAWGQRFGFPKGTYSADMKALGLDPWENFNENMLKYCIQDVELNYRLWLKLMSKNPTPGSVHTEHEVHKICLEQEAVGFPFDVPAAATLQVELIGKRAELEGKVSALFEDWYARDGGKAANVTAKKTRYVKLKEFPPVRHKAVQSGPRKGVIEPIYALSMFEEGSRYTKIKMVEFSPGSRDHVANRLSAVYGWVPTEFTNDGKPKVDDEILSDLDYPPCELLTEYYVVAKRLGTLADGKSAWLKNVTSEGRLHGRCNTNGAITHRATHSIIANVPSLFNAKGPVAYGGEMRSLFCTIPGHKIVGADVSGLELRGLAHFMAKYDGGAYAKELLKGDIHTANMKAAGLPTRDNAKTFIYAFLYGAGDEKIGTIAPPTAAEIEKWGKDPAITKRILKDGREPTPKLVATFIKGAKLKARFLAKTPALKMLIDDVKKAAKKGWIKGLDGRTLYVKSMHSALNALLQSAGAIVCKMWVIEIRKAAIELGLKPGTDFQQLIWYHDETQTLVVIGKEDTFVRATEVAINRCTDIFALRCPLASEAKVGDNWKETH